MARIILMTDFTESYANELLKGIVRYCRDHRPWSLYRLPKSHNETNGLESVVDFAVRWNADAIIGQFRPGDDLSLFRKNGIIVIAQDHDARFPDVCNIVGEHTEVGRKCANYFILRGYRSFAFYGREGKIWSDERRDGFRQEIFARVPGASFSSRDSAEGAEGLMDDAGQLSGWLKSLPKPLAVLACNDSSAYHIIQACELDGSEELKIPGMVSVLGVDNDETVCLLCHPQLSSLARSVEKVGFESARLIDNLMQLPLSERFSRRPEDLRTPSTDICTRNSTDAFLHDNQHVNAILNYIEHNIDRDIQIGDIVSSAQVSRRLLETVFKREIGVSIYQFILSTRVERIKNLILNGESAKEALSHIDVDSRTLSNLFRQATGMTPLQFEKSVRR